MYYLIINENTMEEKSFDMKIMNSAYGFISKNKIR